MIDPLDFENRPLIKALQRKRFVAGFAMFIERVTLSVWRASVWTLFFAALWMFQIPLLLGQTVSILTALLYIGGLLYLIWMDSLYLRKPQDRDVDRRIEQDSAIAHRPISALQDKLANPEKPETRDLWDSSKAQLLGLLPQLKFSKPKAFMARTDPYALRFGVLLFFIAGLIISGHSWNERIRYGAAPFSFNDTSAMQRGVSLWITPPEYTRLGQIILDGTNQSEEPIQIPEGSALKLRVSGGLGKPVLHIGEQKWPLDPAGEGSYMLEMNVPEGQSLTIKQFMLTRAAWNYDRLPDAPPTITLSENAPEIMPEGTMRFPMTLHDDYGVQTLRLHARLNDEIEGPPLGTEIDETRSIISPGGQDFEIAPLYDLTAHPWAGLPATFEFTATDHAGNSISTPPIEMALPERIFRHPVASRLIALRKELIWSPDSNYLEIGGELEDILFEPHNYQDDKTVFLALRAASSRLYYESRPNAETGESVATLLWDIALRIEDGNLTLAARNLRDAQNALEQALRNPESAKEDIAKLMNDLRQAMSEYLMELQKEMQKRIASGEQMLVPPEMLSQVIEPDALASFLDQMEAEMMSGDKNTAQEMLSQLQRMMDMMNPSMAQPLPMDMQMMADGVSELQQLIESQEKLLSRTQQKIEIWQSLLDFQRDYGDLIPRDDELLKEWGIDNMPPPPSKQDQMAARPSINTQDSSEEQEALRYILGQLMLEAAEILEDIPENMGKAEREMMQSVNTLRENQPALSIPHQELAIKHLKEAQQNLSQQFAQRMQQMTGMALSGGQMRYDPLGRPYGENGGQNPFPGSKIEIPDEAERKRVQEILRLLRERSGDQSRPREELEYYRRLLKQF